MRLPSTNPITMQFGATTDPYSPDDPHMGVDFAYAPDNLIYAPFNGTVVQIPDNGRDGNGTYMNFGNQFHGLLHASKYLVPNNTYVKEGQPIAVMGDTGFAQGVHLHWCIKINNQFVNPLSVLPASALSKGEQPMTKQEAVAILDSIWWAGTGRKIKDTELDEYVPVLLAGTPDKFVKKFFEFAEVKAHLAGQWNLTETLDRDTVINWLSQNVKG